MERADRYKAQVIRLKEMSARGQRVEEKRASILPTNMIHKDELLSVSFFIIVVNLPLANNFVLRDRSNMNLKRNVPSKLS